MVGIPGKSKGCHTCRRRKIRCDLQQPDCARCIQSGKICEGYKRGAVFLNRTAQGWQRRTRLEEAQPREAQPRQDGPSLPPALNPNNAGKQMLQGIFLDGYLPKSPKSGPGLQGAWLFESIRLNNPGPALDYALHALCITRVGRITGHQDLIKRGNSAYGFALRALRIALESHHLAGRDETLAACLILSIYELYESTSGSTASHEDHLAGIERLAQWRGPKRYETVLGKALIKNISYASMIQSLQYRKASRIKDLVDSISWWDMQGVLFAKGHALGALIQDLDRYKNFGPHTLAASATYLKRCCALNTEFEDWFEQLIGESPSPIYWTGSGTKKSIGISFASLYLAHLMLDYWTLRLILSTTIDIICSEVPKDIPPTMRNFIETLKLDHGNARQIELATNIMRSIPFCLKDEYGASSSQKCLFSGRVALYALRRHPSEQLTKFQATFLELTIKKGLRFAQDIDKKEMTSWTPVLSEKG